MIDIVEASSDGMKIFNTQAEKGANILSVQLGSLEYLPDLGIDLKYFLAPDLVFQNESFKAYLVQVLATNGINVTSLIERLDALSSAYIINLSPEENSTGMIAR